VNCRIQKFWKFSDEIINNRLKELRETKTQSDKPKDIVDALFRAQHIEGKEGSLVTSRNIISEFLLFYIAATGTTPSHIYGLLLYVSRHPQVKQKMQDEIDRLFSAGQPINAESLRQMTYTSAVMHETNRIYGPGISLFTREVAIDTKLGKVPLKAGTLLNHEFITNNYNPEFYINPKEFRPERWL
jgi:cytochrome P450